MSSGYNANGVGDFPHPNHACGTAITTPGTNRPSSFVAACLPTFASHAHTTMTRYPGYITPEALNHFLRTTANKHLSSIGIALHGARFGGVSRIGRKYVRKYASLLADSREKAFLNGCEVVVDSGGFDLIQQGRLPLTLFLDYIDFYHEFLLGHPKLFEMAFHLDLAPGYAHNPFPDERQMSSYNYVSYKKTAGFPPDVRQRMAYIHHFRTPAILRVWRRMLFEYRLADGFSVFSTGGLATSPEMTQLGCLAYVLPLIDILTHLRGRQTQPDGFRFHILGDSDWKDLLAHAVLEKHLRTVFGLDVEITCDSSNLFKTVALARHTFSVCEGQVFMLSLRSDRLHTHHMDSGSQQALFYQAVNDALTPYGIRPLSPGRNPIYVGGIMTPLAYLYAFMHQLHLFKVLEDQCREHAEIIYPLYRAGDYEAFERELEPLLGSLHSGMTTSRIPRYAQHISESLRLIERMDLDEVERLVRRLPEQKEFRT